MTLQFYRSLVQNELHSLDVFRAETESAMEHGLIRTIDGQTVQTCASLLGQLMRYAVENGTEVGRGGHHDLGVASPAASLREREKQSPSPGSDERCEQCCGSGLINTETGHPESNATAHRADVDQCAMCDGMGRVESGPGSDKTLPLGKKR